MSRSYFGRFNQSLALTQLPQQPHTYQCAQLFFWPMPVDFTAPAIANEVTSGYTRAVDFDLVLRGAWSDLTAAFVQFKNLGGGDFVWSWPLRTNIQAWTGNTAKAVNMRYWRRPNFLRAIETIEGQFQNVGSEDPGDVIFIGEIYGADIPYAVRSSRSFDLHVDLGGTQPPTTTPVPFDLLIHGAVTNVEDTSIIAQVRDDRSGWPWSNEQVPIVSMAGLDSATQPVMWYHKPYLLRSNNKLRVDISSQVDGNYMVFLGEQVLEGNLA